MAWSEIRERRVEQVELPLGLQGPSRAEQLVGGSQLEVGQSGRELGMVLDGQVAQLAADARRLESEIPQ